MKKILIAISMSLVWLVFSSCEHSHEPSKTMKEVIEVNVKLWEDLNSLKKEVRIELKKATSIDSSLDSLQKKQISKKLTSLLAQKKELNLIDALIPELEGYEPKCNHEPGETHSHNTLDLNGVPEEELLEIHKELRRKLDKVAKDIRE